MITLSFDWAVAIYLTVAIGVVFTFWIIYTFKRDRSTMAHYVNMENIQQCPYCTYVFYNYNEGNAVQCPRCQSYINKDQ